MVVLSPPSGGVVVITVVGLFGLAVSALLVQPASITVMATAATAPSLLTVGIMALAVGSVVSRTAPWNEGLTLVGASV